MIEPTKRQKSLQPKRLLLSLQQCATI